MFGTSDLQSLSQEFCCHRWESFCPLWLYVLQGVCDLNVGSYDVSVGLRAPWTLTAVPQLPKQTVETLPTRPVHEQHEQQAAAAPWEQHELGHAQKCSLVMAQALPL